jgi:PD-(D/E)XK nuclease superfamily
MNSVPFPRVIDSTLRASFVSCPHKFYREYLQHWKPNIPSIHLIAGGAFAKGIETTRMAYYGEHKSPEVAVGEGIAALIREYGEFEPNDSTSAKGIENMCGALVEYFTVHPLETDPVRPHIVGGVPAVEFSFALPLSIAHPETGDPILYAGRFDMLGEYNGALFAVDEKTASQLGGQWQKNWTLRSQLTGYCWAAREYGYPVAGAIIRGISILKSGYGNAESIQYRPQWQLDRWYVQLIRDIERMIHCWKEGYWDYNLDGTCSSYGGCPFLDVCNSPDPERWLEADFVQKVWTPLSSPL